MNIHGESLNRQTGERLFFFLFLLSLKRMNTMGDIEVTDACLSATRMWNYHKPRKRSFNISNHVAVVIH